MRATIALLLAGCTPVLTSPDGGVEFEEWLRPENAWPQGDDPSRLEGTGYKQGDVIHDFRMLDQNGEEVALWQFYGMVVLLDFSATWCGPCRVLAADAQETYADYADQGFVYVTVLFENEDNLPPLQSELQEWAELYELQSPVVSDDLGYAYTVEPNSGWPALMVIDRDMVVAVERVVPTTDAAVRAAIDSVLQQ